MTKLGKEFWLLWSGYTVSTLGTYLSLIVINLFIYQATGSALMVGIFMLLRLLPAFFMGNLAGVLADRYDRRRLIIAADLARAALILSMILVRQEIFPLYVIIFGIALCDRLYVSALGGALPNVAGSSNLVKANAYLASGRTIALVSGPLIGGLVAAFGAYDVAFGIDAATYLFSATAVALMTVRFQTDSMARRRLALGASLREGYGYIFARAGLMSVILVRSLDAFGSSAINVGAPLFASEFNNPSAGICYGLIYAAFGTGEMIGSLFLARRAFIQQRPAEQVVGITILLMALTFAAAFSTAILPLALAGMTLSGIFEGVTVVTYNLHLQRNPDELRGRIVGSSETTVWTAMGIGMFLSGLLAERLPIGAVVRLFAALIAAGCVVHIILWRRRSAASGQSAEGNAAAVV